MSCRRENDIAEVKMHAYNTLQQLLIELGSPCTAYLRFYLIAAPCYNNDVAEISILLNRHILRLHCLESINLSQHY